jgi:two-component system sensor kinase FixL
MATAADPVLTISTRNDNGKAILVDFTDRGPGVSGDIADRLFEPLVTQKTSGMGIGLSLSRAIASIHSGALTVSSSTAQGATFTLKLPVESTN